MENYGPCLICLQPKVNLNSSTGESNTNTEIRNGDCHNDNLLLPFVVECLVDNVDSDCHSLISQATNKCSRFFCDECYNVASKGYNLHSQMLKLHKKLMGLKSKMKKRLATSKMFDVKASNLSKDRVNLREIFDSSIQPSFGCSVKIEVDEENTNCSSNSDTGHDNSSSDEPVDNCNHIELKHNVPKAKKLSVVLEIPEKRRTRKRKRLTIHSGSNSESEEEVSNTLRRKCKLGDTLKNFIVITSSDCTDSNEISSDENSDLNEDGSDSKNNVTTRPTSLPSSLICDICGKSSLTIKAFQTHQTLHQTQKKSTCRICKFPCLNKLALAAHYKLKHSSEPMTSRQAVWSLRTRRKKTGN